MDAGNFPPVINKQCSWLASFPGHCPAFRRLQHGKSGRGPGIIIIYHMCDVRVERRVERTSLNVGTLTANMEASSFSAQPLAAWRSTLAVLWQSM